MIPMPPRPKTKQKTGQEFQEFLDNQPFDAMAAHLVIWLNGICYNISDFNYEGSQIVFRSAELEEVYGPANDDT